MFRAPNHAWRLSRGWYREAGSKPAEPTFVSRL
jgi:hypothetical protein